MPRLRNIHRFAIILHAVCRYTVLSSIISDLMVFVVFAHVILTLEFVNAEIGRMTCHPIHYVFNA